MGADVTWVGEHSTVHRWCVVELCTETCITLLTSVTLIHSRKKGKQWINLRNNGCVKLLSLACLPAFLPRVFSVSRHYGHYFDVSATTSAYWPLNLQPVRIDMCLNIKHISNFKGLKLISNIFVLILYGNDFLNRLE